MKLIRFVLRTSRKGTGVPRKEAVVSLMRQTFEPNVSRSSAREFTGSDTQNSLDEYKRNSNKALDSEDTVPSSPKPAPCKAGRFLLSGSQDENGFHAHYRTFCKSYRCVYCGPKKVALVRRAIELAIEKYELRVFASLTLDPKTCPVQPEGSAKFIRQAWNKFRILQKREFGENLDFISVPEFQKSGFAHLHILFNRYLPHAWVKEKWCAVGGGSIVDIRRADKGAARYLAKYLGKEMLSETRPKLRGYTTSQSISLMKLVRRVQGEGSVRYRFCKVEEAGARFILRRYIQADILDRKNFITGFLATRQLGGPEEAANVTLR